MRIIKIDTACDCSSLFANGMWKEFAWGGEDFDDRFVISGNRSLSTCEKAQWYERAVKLEGLFRDGFDYEDSGNICTRDEWNAAYREHCDCVRERYLRRERYDVLDAAVKIARALYPDEVFEKYRITGSCQGEWQYVLFRETGVEDPRKAVQTLHAFYFGNVAQIRSVGGFGEGDYINYVTLDSFREAEYNGRIEKFVRGLMEGVLEDGEKIEVYVSDGEIRRRKWKRIVDEVSEGDPEEKSYIVVETVDRDSSLLPGPDGKDLMTLRQALDVIKHGFEEFCRAYGYDPDEYTEKEAEDDFAGFSFESRSAYSNIRVSIDWKVVEVRR